MKILSLYYTHKPGGFCKRLYLLLNGLAARGHEVHYLSLDTPPGLDSRIILHRIPFLTAKRRGVLFWALFTLWLPFYCAFVSLRIKPERYLTFGAYYSAACLIAKWLAPAPLILFIRSVVSKINEITHSSYILRRMAGLLERLGYASANKIIIMTDSMRKEIEGYLGVSLNNYEILPNNIPQITIPLEQNRSLLQSILPSEAAKLLTDKTFIMLSSGVLDKRKNISFLLELCAALKPDTDYLLLIAGSGPQIEPLKKRSKELNLDRVIFLGWQEEMAPLYQTADLVIHPSLHEGMPNSVMEALAYDLPVLASDIPEHREILESAELLFDPFQSNLLAHRISDILHVNRLLDEMRVHSRTSANRFRFDWVERAVTLVTEKIQNE